ncbi:MAG: acyl-CoA dehydratase activase-related protein [Bacillota bacterium]|nr:acyl-CoA dehydratase activase-related protein [Bacillota bacterium]
MKIGIPRTLTYYAYLPLWKGFFEALGCEVVVSDKTSKGILDKGVEYAVNDACIPIKLFHGHVYNLKERVDFLFVPRLLNLTREKTVTYCPKFLGLADMVRASMPGLPPLLDFRIDLRKKRKERQREFKRMATLLGVRPAEVDRAFRRAQRKMSRTLKDLSGKGNPEEVLGILTEDTRNVLLPPQPITLAVVGYPYLLYDDFVNAGLISKLHKMGVRVLTPEMVPEKTLKRKAKSLPKDLFWTFSNQVVRGAIHYIDDGEVDGIIHVTAFGCGPDSMVGKLIELEAKQKAVPYICISLDEHTGEAGVLTRLEAFVDMLKYRRDKQ